LAFRLGGGIMRCTAMGFRLCSETLFFSPLYLKSGDLVSKIVPFRQRFRRYPFIMRPVPGDLAQFCVHPADLPEQHT
jgi:hypothetical protein